MERRNTKAIALGLALTAGALIGCEMKTDVKKSSHQEIATFLKQDCPEGKKPVLYEVYTTPIRPPKTEIELITGKIRKELTDLMVSCEPDSGAPVK